MDIKDRKNAGRKVCAKLQSLEMQISLPQSITHTHTHTHTEFLSLSPHSIAPFQGAGQDTDSAGVLVSPANGLL